jgi:single-strand DNA-binding protein
MANEMHFSGYMTKDPESSPAGETRVTRFRLADTETWKGKDGEKHERTTFLNIEVWGGLGDWIAKNKSKGSWISVKGRYQVQEWEGKEGDKRYNHFLKARRDDPVDFGPKVDGDGGGGSKNSDYGKPSEEKAPAGSQDDIPF